ncbi:CocE/NonD family hydrolase [Mesorhizobium sp. M5C.F.Cr.IN.023.01.1.1]|uniref:CocE/NonD family hydrolase n=1 Tax=Mesorhizobium sp. M5C.F.Cr.IN.023.01.1.1 TaxID=2496768 RepID=UPI000FCADE68|nr:CocE/NonD family hydrolase [Mesorhizobium sp. M5C.F.Cr.IN.023.01.1.1]RUV68129.1 CocE/NonD family hydrolase [Mesorhizobium sp. M5C.F.Cr.IN.023.01.1.1]
MALTIASRAEFAIRVVTGVRVRMSDGAELNVRITCPVAPGKYPAVLEYNPYRKLVAVPSEYRDETVPVIPFLAERGYVVVQYDVRGTGGSSGFSTDMYSEEERRDGYDMVEWCATQDWCTGSVGMIGLSYGAVVQWQVAKQNPPHLKAIVVRSGGVDLASEFASPGGCIRPWLFESYAPRMTASNFSPPDATLAGDRWAGMWQERLSNSAPWGLSFIRNLHEPAYWRSRSLAPDYDQVQCAVLLIEGWADWYATAELNAYQRLSCPRKILIGPWGHYYPEAREAFPGPRIDGRYEYLRWFDHFLKGVNNGVTNEPPVTVFVRGWKTPALICSQDAGVWRSEAKWPPDRVSDTAAYFGNSGTLTETPQEGSETYQYRPAVGLTTGRLGIGSTSPWGMSIDQRLDDAHSVLYEMGPLSDEMELLGEPKVVLFASSTAEVAYFAARLCDVAPDGTSRLITDGGVLSSRRNSNGYGDVFIPNKVMKTEFTLRHCAYRIERGHRVRVAIASASFQNAWPTGQAAYNTIHRGPRNPSRILLPIAGKGQEGLSPPDFLEPANPQLAPQSIAIPTYALHHDLIGDSVTCELAAGDITNGGYNRSTYTISNRDPANTIIEAKCLYRPQHPSTDIQVEANCRTVSDAKNYTHEVQVSIKTGGRLFFEKEWTECAPRGLS